MTKKVITLSMSDTLYDTIQCLSKNQISGCPVINSKKQVVGVVHDSDITRAINVNPKATSSKLFLLLFAALRSKEAEKQISSELKHARSVKVKDFMSPSVVINKNASFSDAVKEMADSDITRLAVVDDSKKLVGIVARSDIIKAFDKAL